jgi:hypothetical protein
MAVELCSQMNTKNPSPPPQSNELVKQSCRILSEIIRVACNISDNYSALVFVVYDQ